MTPLLGKTREGRCRRVYILEGPDGGGKTELARRLQALTAGRVIHLGPFPRVTQGLSRVYAEALLPALLGYEDVILDRSWLSELPYGQAFRDGQDRVGNPGRAMLARLALRCQALVVLCLPPWDACRRTFEARRAAEYLKTVEQLRQVHAWYAGLLEGPAEDPMFSQLPLVWYDHTRGDQPGLILDTFQASEPHLVDVPSGGNLRAPFVLIGESFGELKDHDPLLARAPFVSFSREGCAWWLTEQLGTTIGEDQLLWLNADFPRPELEALLRHHPRALVVALGAQAADLVGQLDLEVPVAHVPHPQHAKRFHHNEPYPLLEELRRHL